MRSNLDGSSFIPFIRNTGRTKDININFIEKRIYWLDLDGKKIESVDFDGCMLVTYKSRMLYSNETEAITDLFIFQSIRPRTVKENPCLKSNGNCSQLCIYLPSSPKSYVCSCRTHYSLSDDAKTCLPPPSFLLFSKKSSVTRLLSDVDQCPTFVLPIPNLRNVQAITFDPINNILLWIDSRAQHYSKSKSEWSKNRSLG
ncbi:hypothetical protein Avbf_09065 [Armadillidium vulgare]|nr:hypothetical protein Avbf_09065 [Armadillidium vulgare]